MISSLAALGYTKDIAKLIKKYNKTEIGKKVWNSFR